MSMVETLHTSQLAEQTIFQMHAYIKIKAEIKKKNSAAFSLENQAHYMPFLSALSLLK